MKRIYLTAILINILLSGHLAQAQPIAGPDGSYYERVDLGSTGLLWTEARDAAASRSFQARDGQLATIFDQATQTFVWQNFRIGAPSNCWLGGTDAVVEGDWRWVSGELFWRGDSNGSVQNNLYENWNDSEPNNSGDEDGLEMWSDGTWNDESNTSRRQCYVVEYPSSSSTASPSPTEIPTMSAYGLTLTVLGLLVAAGRRLRTSARR